MDGEHYRHRDNSRVALVAAAAALYFLVMHALPTPSREPSIAVSRAVLPSAIETVPEVKRQPIEREGVSEMKRDQFFFPSAGGDYWSSSHQALLHHHRQANCQQPSLLPVMPEPDFSYLNDLPMPLFYRDARWQCGQPAVAAERKPMTLEERKAAERGVLVAAALACFVPSLGPIGVFVFFCFSIRAAFRLLRRIVRSGWLQSSARRFAGFVRAELRDILHPPQAPDTSAELEAWIAKTYRSAMCQAR